MKPLAIFIDLDGTLLSNEKMISNSDYMAMNQYIKDGGKIFIATGRSSIAASNIVHRLNLTSEYIAYNGACIYLGTNQYKYFPLTQNEIILALSIADKYFLKIMLYTKDEVFVKEVDNTNISRISDTIGLQKFELLEDTFDSLKIIETQQFFGVITSRCILKIAFLSDQNGMLLNACEELKKFNLNVICTNKYIEMISVSSNKYKGATYILDKYSVNMADIMVIGDGENDIELLECAGIGVAMDNACDVVKKVAKYVTNTNDNSGVSEAIIKYALI